MANVSMDIVFNCDKYTIYIITTIIMLTSFLTNAYKQYNYYCYFFNFGGGERCGGEEEQGHRSKVYWGIP